MQAVWLYFSSCFPKQVLFPCGFCLASLQLMVSSWVPCYQTLHQTQSCRVPAAHVASMICTSMETPACFCSCFCCSHAERGFCWFDVCSSESHKRGCMSDWRLMIQGVGTSMGLADPEGAISICELDYLFNVILVERRDIKYPCLQMYAACTFCVLGI